jgi:hypothetical protein
MPPKKKKPPRLKKIAPRKRTIFINNHRFFLEFPEILETKGQMAINLDGKYYYLPLPNIHEDNSICHGNGSGIKDFWVTRFTDFHIDCFAPGRNLNSKMAMYNHWQKNGFESIKNFLVEIKNRSSFKFINFAGKSAEEAIKIIKNNYDLYFNNRNGNHTDYSDAVSEYLNENPDVFLTLIKENPEYIKIMSDQTFSIKWLYIKVETVRVLRNFIKKFKTPAVVNS